MGTDEVELRPVFSSLLDEVRLVFGRVRFRATTDRRLKIPEDL